MNEAILNPHASERRRSHAEDSGADSDYANIVAELRQLRAASQLNRYRGAAPRLPSREAINEIVESLVSALYPRHFGPPGLDARDADAFVARTLAKALPALGHEIERRWPSSRRTRATRPMRTFDPRLRSRARLPRLCRRFAPPSTGTSAPLSRTTRQRRASTRLSSAFPGSPRSCATAWRTSSTGSARLCSRGLSQRSPTRWPVSTSTPGLRLERVFSSTTARAS
jgi:hypothetical protein